ncbi:MAG: DNA-binding protein [Bacteroidales bacterium 45-6]|nr:MAG: DNA-binding protein [Bacteroidales bacterium 45-6]
MELSAIQSKIHEIRGCRVMLDFDLAEMYGVETKNLNLSVKRNARRFPFDFMFQLTEEEWHSLRLQIETSKRGGRRYMPYAFTEQGVAMLSGLLNSNIAIEININIMRAFVAVRRFIMSPPVNEVKQLQDEVKELKGYIEEVFADYNDMNEDTRLQLDLINEALAELQMKNRQVNRTRNPVGYVRPEE